MPWPLRPRLARDPTLLSRALACFVRAVFRWQRAQARALGIVGAAPGAVTAVQRFGSALQLKVHFHTLVPDGVFVADAVAGGPRFVPLPPPTDDVAAIAGGLPSRPPNLAASCARLHVRAIRRAHVLAEPSSPPPTPAPYLLHAPHAPRAVATCSASSPGRPTATWSRRPPSTAAPPTTSRRRLARLLG